MSPTTAVFDLKIKPNFPAVDLMFNLNKNPTLSTN